MPAALPPPALRACTHPHNKLPACARLRPPAVGWLELRRFEAGLAERAAKQWEAELAQHEEQGYPSFKTGEAGWAGEDQVCCIVF